MMTDVSLPLTLSIGLALFVLMIGVWQVPRIRVYLSGNHAAEPVKKDKLSGLKHWGKLLAGLVLFLVIGLFGEAWYWTQQSYEMAGLKYYYGENNKENKTHQSSFPTNYIYKKVLWQLGFVPLPTFVSIKAGEFEMGSNKNDNEKPVHTVKIPTAFSMSQHEITFEQYDYFIWQMKKANPKQAADEEDKYRYPYDESWGRDNRPVMNISWWDAQAYANWLSKEKGQTCRLPSEAEWEYAARAGSAAEYSWGEDIGKNNANCNGCGSEWDGKQTAPVGSFKPNAFGLHDMHGNLWEWVQDPWHGSYEGSPDNGDAWEVDGDFSRRVVRGGSWLDSPVSLRSAYRNNFSPVSRYYLIGFRIVCSSH